MSRHTKKQGDLDIAYGYDFVTGYFFQAFGEDGEDENLVVDECSCFTNMSKARMVELMEQYEVDRSHIEKVVLDLPI